MNIQFITRRPLNRAPTISTELLTSTRFHALIPVSFAALRMTQNSIISKTDAPEPDRSQHSTKQRPELRDLLPFVAGGKLFGVFAEDADGTAESKPWASLPHAPATILGVVCVRGRVLTVLDPVAICTSQSANWKKPLPYVVVLRGDEQLALAAEECRDLITIAAADISAQVNGAEAHPEVTGVVRHAGEEITILDIDNLFASAMQRRERRRRQL